ncbi:hypothetical protein COOONC_06935 [Cooperia oncophora]
MSKRISIIQDPHFIALAKNSQCVPYGGSRTFKFSPSGGLEPIPVKKMKVDGGVKKEEPTVASAASQDVENEKSESSLSPRPLAPSTFCCPFTEAEMLKAWSTPLPNDDDEDDVSAVSENGSEEPKTSFLQEPSTPAFMDSSSLQAEMLEAYSVPLSDDDEDDDSRSEMDSSSTTNSRDESGIGTVQSESGRNGEISRSSRSSTPDLGKLVISDDDTSRESSADSSNVKLVRKELTTSSSSTSDLSSLKLIEEELSTSNSSTSGRSSVGINEQELSTSRPSTPDLGRLVIGDGTLNASRELSADLSCSEIVGQELSINNSSIFDLSCGETVEQDLSSSSSSTSDLSSLEMTTEQDSSTSSLSIFDLNSVEIAEEELSTSSN